MIGTAVGRALGRAVVAVRRLPGGDLNEAWAVELEGGARAFVKARADARAGEYATEAAGLRWLGELDGGPAVPRVLAVGDAHDTRALGLQPRGDGRTDPARGAGHHGGAALDAQVHAAHHAAACVAARTAEAP